MAHIKAFLTAASVLAMLAAAPVSALSVSVGGGDASVKTETSVNVNTAATTTPGSVTGGNDTYTNIYSSSSASASIPLVITQSNIASKSATHSATLSAAGVQTTAQLSDFISTKLRGDPQFASVDTAADHVAVTYQEPAMLFGFIPVALGVTATTDAYGKVSLASPWWGFFASSDQTNLRSGVQAAVDSVLGASVNSSANSQLSASQQAQLVTAIQAAMGASASSNVSGSASTT